MDNAGFHNIDNVQNTPLPWLTLFAHMSIFINFLVCYEKITLFLFIRKYNERLKGSHG